MNPNDPNPRPLEKQLGYLSLAHYFFAALVAGISLYGIYYISSGMDVRELQFWTITVGVNPGPDPQPIAIFDSANGSEEEVPQESAFKPEDIGLEVDNRWDVPTEAVGGSLIAIGVGLILVAWTIAGFLFAAGRKLDQRRGYAYCLLAAIVETVLFPLGTILGIFTILVLLRDSVRRSFSR